jgi:hypothetical protein
MFTKSIFHLHLIEAMDLEPENTEGRLLQKSLAF